MKNFCWLDGNVIDGREDCATDILGKKVIIFAIELDHQYAGRLIYNCLHYNLKTSTMYALFSVFYYARHVPCGCESFTQLGPCSKK